VLNRNIGESRKAQALCRQLDGRVVSLTVEGTPFAFFSRRKADGLRSRRGTTATRTRACRHSDRAAGTCRSARRGCAARGGVRIEGDAEVAQKFRELLAQAQPDFEEELAA